MSAKAIMYVRGLHNWQAQNPVPAEQTVLPSQPTAASLRELRHLRMLLYRCRSPCRVSTSVQSASYQVAFCTSHNRHLPLQQVCSACPLCPAPFLQKCETDTLGNGRQLTYGDYRDASRALRRSLKQLGSGALEAGIRQLTASEAAAEEVASLIGVNALVRLPHMDLYT